MTNRLTHINNAGEATMVDVSAKSSTVRIAHARAMVQLGSDAFRQLLDGSNSKGDVLAVARIAGIQAAKKCSDLIPLCHPLMLSSASIEFTMHKHDCSIEILSRCKIASQTGVEMEALTGVSVAALTIYDMCKAVDKAIEITSIHLIEKSGGKSGDWRRSENKDD
jgi:cyclic pyranopterin phosphate synthase